MLHQLASLENLAGAAVVLALFIIWKLIEEKFRANGIKRWKGYLENNCHEMKCGWSNEDHKFLVDIRDCVKHIEKVIGKEK